MRICSLLPSATEILFALGLGEHVTGVSHECDYPPEARAKVRVTTGLIDPELLSSAEIDSLIAQALSRGLSIYHIDMDALRLAQPDLLITQDLCAVCAVDGNQVRLAAGRLETPPRVVTLAPNSVHDVLASIHLLGEAAGATTTAEQLVAALSARIDVVQRGTANCDRPRVLCLEWLDPAWVAGHWMPEVVAIAGGVDVLGSPSAPSRRVTWAEILAAQPEVVILMPCGFDVERTLTEVDVLLTVPEVTRLPAFQSGRVYAVDGSSYFSRAGPRLIEGTELLAATLHPDVFSKPLSPSAVRKLRA